MSEALKVNVYIDGVNLYRRALHTKGKIKTMDLEAGSE